MGARADALGSTEGWTMEDVLALHHTKLEHELHKNGMSPTKATAVQNVSINGYYVTIGVGDGVSVSCPASAPLPFLSRDFVVPWTI